MDAPKEKNMTIVIRETKDVKQGDIIEIYEANKWSSAEKPDKLFKALLNSHSFITAWHNERLVGLGNALSDGHLVVYYPHLIVHPNPVLQRWPLPVMDEGRIAPLPIDLSANNLCLQTKRH